MPELPEVETVRRTLAPAVGRAVTSVWTSGLPLRQNKPIDVPALEEASRGKTLEAVRRLGKYLLLDFAGRAPRSVIVHLGMSGRLRLVPRAAAHAPHTHVVWRLRGADDPRELRFSDPRRFGIVDTVARGAERAHPALAGLGVDPLEESVDPAWLYRTFRTRKRTLKALLLDQGLVAGIGNIYASEALWQAGIRPTARGTSLSRTRAESLAAAIPDVLERALTRGGTSLRDFVDADGNEGENAHYLWVYGREGEPCMRCQSPISRRVQEGRATFYCPRCQAR